MFIGSEKGAGQRMEGQVGLMEEGVVGDAIWIHFSHCQRGQEEEGTALVQCCLKSQHLGGVTPSRTLSLHPIPTGSWASLIRPWRLYICLVDQVIN